tara:strand:- start:241 stop:909 length:669 start_codon:yes stop_codon:yes gene_type:complete
MNDVTNLRDTIIPKSDQLNADDLVGTTMTIMVSGVSRGNDESPLVINYNNDSGRPFKPCKTMRKLLIVAWGENGNEWLGKSMSLYCDDKVKYAGKNVGGIRISHLSHIPKRIEVNLTATRGKKQLYTVNILQAVMYPVDQFNKAFEAMKDMVVSGKMTAAQIITKCSQTGTLSDDQLLKINSINPTIDAPQNGFEPAKTVEKVIEPEIEKPVVTEEQIQNNF